MTKIRNNNQGVILVLTLIIMSILLATAISFAVFIISDVKQAKSIDDSIGAYYAADAGIEQSLFQFRKGWVTSTRDLYPTSTMVSSTASWNVIKYSTNTEDVILRQRLYNGQSIKLFFLGRVAGSNQVNGIKIPWKQGGGGSSNMQVTFTQLSPQNGEDGQSVIYYTDQSKLERLDSSVVSSTCYKFMDAIINSTDINPADYAVEIKALGAEGDYIESLRVQAYDTSDCSGVPIKRSISNIAIVSEGSKNQSIQRITAHIPPKDPVSGILSFVLFSEEDITKE